MDKFFVKIIFALNLSFFIIPFVYSQTIWTKNNFKVEVENGQIKVFDKGNQLVDITSINFNFTKPKAIDVKVNNADSLILQLTYPVVASYRLVNHDLVADIFFKVTGEGTLRIYSVPDWAQNITIQLKDLGEHFFGVLEQLYPNNLKSPDLRGDFVDVNVKGNASQYHENYADVWSAFYMTNKGYASFFNTFAKGRYEFAINGRTELYHHTGKMDWYLFTGDNGNKILKQYYKVIGYPKFIPLWACGPVAWRDQNNGGKDEILSDIQKMTDLKIPFTAWFVDRPYSNGADDWSKMDFNSKFSDAKDWIKTINDKFGLQFMSWIAPMTFDDKDFPGLLPNFKGYIDLTNPEAVKEFEERLKKYQYSVNVRGHKMDRADEEFPEMSPWYDKTPEQDHRNKYIYLYAKVIDKFLNDAFGKDQFNFARSGFQGCQQYLSAVWGGDSRSTWDGYASSIATSMRCGFMGFPIWGSDVGGYLGGRIPESLYARWLQFGSWSGLFEIKLDNAGGNGEDRPPWKYGQKLQDIFRNVCAWRMEILPYIYSCSNTSYKNGVMMKPLAYEYPLDKNVYNIWNEYLFGNAFLVAPIVDSSNSRKVYLPEGTWINFYNLNEKFSGRKTIDVSLPLDKIPVYIKENSIYVTGNLISGNSKNWIKDFNKNEKIIIHVFPGENGQSATFDYIDYFNKNKENKFEVFNNNGIFNINVPAVSSALSIEIKSNRKPNTVEVNGKQIKFQWDESIGLIQLNLEKNIFNKIEVKF